MYILIAILAFGVIVFVHELGHFLAAKACGVKVLEFAVGMGPRLLHVRKGETEYSLRALPMGGFCAMEGEEESSNDPRAFNNQSVLRRLIILAAGSFMNFYLGFLLLMILYAPAGGFTSTVIEEFFPGCPYAGDLTEGDQIYRINGKRVYFTSNVSEFADQDPDGIMDIELIRDGKQSMTVVKPPERLHKITALLAVSILRGESPDSVLIEKANLGDDIRYDTESYDNGMGVVEAYAARPETVTSKTLEGES